MSELRATSLIGNASVTLDVACLAHIIPPFQWSSLALLPETVAFCVLTFLPVGDVVQLGRISREWHAVVDLAGLWTVLLERDFGVHSHAWARTLSFSGYGAGQVTRPWLTQTIASTTSAALQAETIPRQTSQMQSSDTRLESWALATARHQYRANVVFLRQRSQARQEAAHKYQGVFGSPVLPGVLSGGTWQVMLNPLISLSSTN